MALSSSEITNTTGIQLQKGACVVIVRTEWNAHVVDILEEGCKKILQESDVCFEVIEVPGAVEITFAIKSYWENHQYK
ncbi:MAG: 6,7-dimethyl-8-ribityllumazine synthase, partial [Pedobacter sp.]